MSLRKRETTVADASYCTVTIPFPQARPFEAHHIVQSLLYTYSIDEIQIIWTIRIGPVAVLLSFCKQSPYFNILNRSTALNPTYASLAINQA